MRPRLSVPAATGGNALINTGCPSLRTCWSVSLMILGAPALHSPPRGAHWLTSGSRCYFHIDTGDWWRRSRNQSYWPAGEAPTFGKCVCVCLYKRVEDRCRLKMELKLWFLWKSSWIRLLWRVRSEMCCRKGVICYLYLDAFLVNKFFGNYPQGFWGTNLIWTDKRHYFCSCEIIANIRPQKETPLIQRDYEMTNKVMAHTE